VVSLIITLPVTLVLMALGRGRMNEPDDVMQDYVRFVEALQNGDIAFLDQRLADGSLDMNGVDGFIGRRWLVNAIDLGSVSSVK